MVAYRNIGLGLAVAVFGVVLGLGAYILLGSVPLTAMGIGLVIVGVAWASTPPHPVPRRAVLDIIKSSCSNIEALLEFVGVTKRAIYLPSEGDGSVIAYVPLTVAEDTRDVSLRSVADGVGRVIVRQSGSIGVVVAPPRVEFWGGNPGFEGGVENIEAILDYVLVEASEIAEGVKAVRSEDGFVIEVSKVRVDVDHPRFRAVMGSLPSCLAAQVAALASSRPVQIVDERRVGDRLTVRLRLLDWTETAST